MTSSFERGEIPIDRCPGGVDLRLTLESGQSYHWRRLDGDMFGEQPPGWYETVIDGEYIRVRERDDALEWVSTTDATPILERVLRLTDDLPAIVETIDDPLVAEAFHTHTGMRIVRDPPFVCLISFICSTQMRVPRIHGMVTRLANAYGPSVGGDRGMIHGFPSPERLAEATEAELKDLGLGYRAPYVRETAKMVATGEFTPTDVVDRQYEDARSGLTRFVGVGEKVADCVLLFSLGYLEAVPLDTWIRSAIATYYPECDRGSYTETSAAIRNRFGDRYAGYAQTYVFHHLRTGERPVGADAVDAQIG